MRERSRQAIATATTAKRARAAVPAVVVDLSHDPQRMESPEKNWEKLLHVSGTRSKFGGFDFSQPCVTRQRPRESGTIKYQGKLASATRKMHISKLRR